MSEQLLHLILEEVKQTNTRLGRVERKKIHDRFDEAKRRLNDHEFSIDVLRKNQTQHEMDIQKLKDQR